MIAEKCKSCLNATLWKSKGKMRIDCRKRQDTSLGCSHHEPKQQVAVSAVEANNMRSAL